MTKIGRNDTCPCDSGKKYKKCCMNKPDQASIVEVESFSQYLANFWTYEEVTEMSTNEIIQNLESMGIPFDKDSFLKEVEKSYSAEQISENWFTDFNVMAKDRDEDFPWFAAWVLWERFSTKNLMSMEQISDLIDKGFEYLSENDSKTTCDIWLKVWEALKYRIKPEFSNLDFLDSQYNKSFFIRDFCQDLENELYNAGLEDKAYFEKRINYCREFITYFPDEDELIIHNMRRAIAESYSGMNNYEPAELEYKRLVKDYPDNPWGYIGWGDMYFFGFHKDYVKAKELYTKGLVIVKDETDKMALLERLKDLENEMKVNK